MTSPQTPTSFVLKLMNALSMVERIMLAALVAGIILKVLNIDTNIILISLYGLAATYFLFAYRPVQVPVQESEKKLGFQELLGFTILPKVMWMSCAVSCVGIAFYFLAQENTGYKEMLLIGGTTTGLAVLVLGALLSIGVKLMTLATPILLRAVPLLFTDIYLFFK